MNAQFRHTFAENWGYVTTSSSDGQRFRAGGKAESSGHINPKYGSEPGRLFYTRVSDQYAPFCTKVVNVGVRDSTYVLDGLLYHESDLRIEEHYTDTAGFTDHVFALIHLLGFRFAPRIRDIKDTKLYVPKRAGLRARAIATSTASNASVSRSPYFAKSSAGIMTEHRFPWRFLQRPAGCCHQLLLLTGLLERNLLPAHQPCNPGGVPVTLRRGARVVAADR
jgi:TnpA family transposase